MAIAKLFKELGDTDNEEGEVVDDDDDGDNVRFSLLLKSVIL